MTGEATFFRCPELGLDEIATHPHLFQQLRSGEVQGAMVHGVYTPQECEETIGRLQVQPPPLLQTWFPGPFRSCFFGRNLNLTAPDLEGYFDEARQFNTGLEQVLPAGRGFDAHLARVLSGLDHGRPFRAAPGVESGQRYMPTTVRRHDTGGYIPAHHDNEFMLRPSYEHLSGIAGPHIFSFVLALSLAESGGALEIFDSLAPALGDELLSDDHHARPDVGGLASVSIRIPPGSMAIFDSGRYLHRVTPVQGERPRWTLCSFLALSHAGDAMYCWG